MNTEKFLSEKTLPMFAFNIWDVNSGMAVIDAAADLRRDVILQTSERVFKNLEKNEFRNYLKNYATIRNINAFIHLDHCKNLDVLKSAVDLHWDSVMYDGSQLKLSENIRDTKEAAKYAHENGVLIEAEVGSIIGVEDDIVIREDGIASILDVKNFLTETDIDMIAVAFGTAHGLYKGTPVLHYEIIEQTASLTDIPFVVHGGTGLSDDVFKKLLSYNNVKKINISTEMKQAYRRGIIFAGKNGFLEESRFESTKVEKLIHDEIYKSAFNKLSLLR